ncbi:MAG TPA: hypothetical protein VLE53_07985, partial [Gemmatimonadaceae bacterium]|nr:hypothetical protein [Gemmatimonadaceae bacterium]
TCHDAPGDGYMDVRPADPDTCLGCHTHRASAHLAEDNRCATCHVALTDAPGLTRERVAALPRPPSHERADFVAAHDPAAPLAAASCAVCHARESCARCHVNASTLPLIAALRPDPRVASVIAGKAAVYPVPADHRRDAFLWQHGDTARADAERCGSCHARPSCTTCHLGPGGVDVLRRIPAPEPGAAPGVRLTHQSDRQRLRPPLPSAPDESMSTTGTARRDANRQGPGAGGAEAPGSVLQGANAPRMVRVHDLGFRDVHRDQAASDALTCSGCHARRFCADCHTGEAGRRYHRVNFAVGHAADAYGREVDCASCHNTQAFCRECHREAGLSSRGRLDVAFHDAQPQWLLQHGRAARQGLQNCASCHAQRDCLTCHATTGWGINPHGPGFNASRMAKRSPLNCLACHLEVPRAGSP